MQSISVFFDTAKLADFWCKNAGICRTQVVCRMIHVFLNLLYVSYSCVKDHHCKICVTDFEEGFSFPPPIREQSKKGPY